MLLKKIYRFFVKNGLGGRRMAVIFSINNMIQRLDSFISGKLFMSLIVFSFAANGFKNKHKIIGKIPFLSTVVGGVVAMSLFVFLIIFAILEPIYLLLKKFLDLLKNAKLTLRVTINFHQFAVALLIAMMFLWIAI